MSYNDCRHGAEMCDQCLDIMSDGIRQGAEEERERIIALLEANASFFTTIEGGTLVNYADDAIALIKGENK